MGVSSETLQILSRARAGGALRAPLLGATVSAASVVAAIAALWLLWRLVGNFNFLLLGSIACVMAGSFGYSTGRQMALPDGLDVLRSDQRRPVVFLRPFFEDERKVYDGPVGAREGAESSAPSIKGTTSPEPKLKSVFNEIGPFVAVGRPGQRLAPFGAHRLYLQQSDWQEGVAALVSQSAAIVIQPEWTPSTSWELQLVAAVVDPRCLLIAVPNSSTRPFGFLRVQQLIVEVLKVELPMIAGGCDAFMFDGRGRPVPIVFGKEPARALAPFVAQLKKLELSAEAQG